MVVVLVDVRRAARAWSGNRCDENMFDRNADERRTFSVPALLLSLPLNIILVIRRIHTTATRLLLLRL